MKKMLGKQLYPKLMVVAVLLLTVAASADESINAESSSKSVDTHKNAEDRQFIIKGKSLLLNTCAFVHVTYSFSEFLDYL